MKKATGKVKGQEIEEKDGDVKGQEIEGKDG